MKTLGRYKITALVALIAFLPVIWRAFPEMPLAGQVAIGLLAAALAGYIEHQKSVEPHLGIEEKRTYLFGYACEGPFEDVRQHDPTARLNIMEIDPGLPGHPGVFRTVYTLGMEGDPDKDLGLEVSQGVCGQAVSQGEFTVADLEVPNGPTFGLTAEQLEKTAGLTLVLSMPVKKTRKMPDGSFTLTDEILGVINVDSKKEGAHAFYRTTQVDGQTLMDAQEETLQEISELCSYIMS